ncbi:Uncharacterised protein [Vibrio cholerae]|nr:Uncharacterised protein [Vibrio cholerae]
MKYKYGSPLQNKTEAMSICLQQKRIGQLESSLSTPQLVRAVMSICVFL